MIDKHLHHPDLPVAASKWSETETLHLAAVYSDHPDYREEWRP